MQRYFGRQEACCDKRTEDSNYRFRELLSGAVLNRGITLPWNYYHGIVVYSKSILNHLDVLGSVLFNIFVKKTQIHRNYFPLYLRLEFQMEKSISK